jgi:hypothetical protein
MSPPHSATQPFLSSFFFLQDSVGLDGRPRLWSFREGPQLESRSISAQAAKRKDEPTCVALFLASDQFHTTHSMPFFLFLMYAWKMIPPPFKVCPSPWAEDAEGVGQQAGGQHQEHGQHGGGDGQRLRRQLPRSWSAPGCAGWPQQRPLGRAGLRVVVFDRMKGYEIKTKGCLFYIEHRAEARLHSFTANGPGRCSDNV